jgi:putative oxidoreductase
MHGWQKFAGGLDGVTGFLGTLGFPAPAVFAVLLIAAEVIGGALLILGLFTHWVAKILAVVALIALLTAHVTKGFFVSEGGYEFALLLFAACVSVAITGAGRWSLDSVWRK